MYTLALNTIPAQNFNRQAISNLQLIVFFSENYRISFTEQEIADQDWNKTCEDNFSPIVVDNRIQVRAGFHTPIPDIEYEIIIEPKMSFGTGHHSTTVLMLRTILNRANEIKGKRVLDMGCGTGILAIMAAKAGAREVTGIDIDDWAFNNAMENISNNQLNNITIKIGDASLLEKENNFDMILANINRNILLADLPSFVSVMHAGSQMILSGFYVEDIPLLVQKAKSLGLSYLNHTEKENWATLLFERL